MINKVLSYPASSWSVPVNSMRRWYVSASFTATKMLSRLAGDAFSPARPAIFIVWRAAVTVSPTDSRDLSGSIWTFTKLIMHHRFAYGRSASLFYSLVCCAPVVMLPRGLIRRNMYDILYLINTRMNAGAIFAIGSPTIFRLHLGCCYGWYADTPLKMMLKMMLVALPYYYCCSRLFACQCTHTLAPGIAKPMCTFR